LSVRSSITLGDDLSEEALSKITVEVRTAQKPIKMALSRFVYEYKEDLKQESNSWRWIWVTLLILLILIVLVVLYLKVIRKRIQQKRPQELDTFDKGEYTMIGQRTESVIGVAQEQEDAGLKEKDE